MSAPRVLDLQSGVRSTETTKDLSRWHSNRQVLHDLYIHQKKSLKEVKAIMESDLGFPSTLKDSDYEWVLREVLKFRKNLSADDWRLSIGPLVRKRKAAGKESEVFLHGSQVENVDRKIQRSEKGKHSYRRANAHNEELPHGVVIRTPSPQPSTFDAPPTFDGNRTANEIERHQRYQSTMDYLADSSFAAYLEWLKLLTGVTPLSDSGSGATVLSAQLMREASPINKLLAIFDEYQRGFNPTDLRLFGPNATIGMLGKMCFDFSNGLQDKTISSYEMRSILDWIGFSVDIASFKAFFAQKYFTTLAVWEALMSTVIKQRHFAAFDVLLSAHLSITDQSPWTKTTGWWYCDFASCMQSFSAHAATLINAYPCNQRDLDRALHYALFDSPGPDTGLVKRLISAGASVKNYRIVVDGFIGDFLRYGCEADELALLKGFLEAGAVIDKLSHGDNLGWERPDRPYLATDMLLLNGEHSTTHRHLWSLVSSYSDRQQTNVTVPGIFEAAKGGQEQLRSYLSSRLKPSGDLFRKQVLEIALSEASGRGYADVVQSLVQFGVDPNVRTLSPFDITGRYHYAAWHPVIRAVNTGKLDTLRILMSTSSTTIALLEEEVGELRFLCSLRGMESSQRDQVIQFLSTLDLDAASRSQILLNNLIPHRCQKHGHDVPDFEFVSQLLELGLASLDRPERFDEETGHVLVRAISEGCGVNALNFLAERDVEILPASSATTFAKLLDVTLKNCAERHEVLEFLARRVKGLQSFIQENVSSLLSSFLEHMSGWCCKTATKHWENNCAAMVTVKWFLDLGAPLEGSVFPQLAQHANDSFMLTLIRNVADVDALNDCEALRWSIRLGRLNLAVALIERGAQVNGRQLRSGKVLSTPLQQACESCAPLWFIRFLVDKGADVNGATAPNIYRTALQAACDRGAELSCIRFLIEKGAAVNAPPPLRRGGTALQNAASQGLMNVAGLLLDHGADVNALSGYLGPSWDFSRLTFMRALDLAARDSRLDMVHFLVAAGARSCKPGSTGFEGAIEVATHKRNFAVARLLREHANSGSGDPLEAERRWLRANPHACLYNGMIQDAGWVAFMKETGRDRYEDFTDYVEEQLNQCHE